MRHVWFLLFSDSELLDLAGPWALLVYANEVIGRQVYATRVVTAAAGVVRTRHCLVLRGAGSLAHAAVGGVTTALPDAKARTVRRLRRHHQRIARVISISRDRLRVALMAYPSAEAIRQP